jgi:endogenous inhibitor of DNA gyrase (YacG/DUF329 family)
MPEFTASSPCKYCGDNLTVEDIIAGREFCSDECALADLTGDSTFVFLEDEDE